MSDDSKQLEVEDLPVSPGQPELVLTAATPTSGLDLLGLRVAAESVANSLLDGVTTITPNVRYLGVRAWIINRYQQLKGLDNRKEFLKFAHKIESAVVFGNLLNDRQVSGLVGPRRANDAIALKGARLELGPLAKNPAVQLYAGPSEALGIGCSRANVPGITRERGIPLAGAVDDAFGKSAIPSAVTADGRPQSFPRNELQTLGRVFPMGRPTGKEREALISFIIPATPTAEEFPRVATYCLILHLCQRAKKEVEESEVLTASTSAQLNAIPAELHESCEGWARFVVRDMLVAVHEAAVNLVCQHIATTSGGSNRRPRQAVLSDLTGHELGLGFGALKFRKSCANAPIKEFLTGILSRLGNIHRVGNIHRWDGDLDELKIIANAEPIAEAMAVLPLAWFLAAKRMEPGIAAEIPDFDLEGNRAASRLGVGDVIVPEVKSWLEEDTPVCDIVARLIARSVDQHLRIAWSRLAREAWKDVSVLASDGDEWIYCQGFNSGRATSRLYQAISWLRQLGLTNDTGLTRDGEKVLQTRLEALGRAKGGNS